jgi:DivIVA domain-containing protein
MAITASEIETKTFVVTFRGYDPAEVHRWLKDLAAHHRALEAQVAREREAALAEIAEARAATERALDRIRAALRDEQSAPLPIRGRHAIPA